MIDYTEAQAISLRYCLQLGSEMRPLSAARNYTLAESIKAPFPLPRFDHSAMDGYAIRTEDVESASSDHPVQLRVTCTLKTGDAASAPVERGCAIRVFTGAMLPPAADGVVMVEDVVLANEVIHLTAPLKSGKNIRRSGEEFAKGEICLSSGIRMTPPAIGLAASLGLCDVCVYRRPRVAVIVTGSELVETGLPLGDAQIYDSNRVALVAALAELGITEVSTFSCADEENLIQRQIEAALSDADVVITSGGASVGDVDFVKPAIKNLGGVVYFDKVAIKPGKPTVFAEVAGKPLFGLPGNPVSALVTYLLFVRPALLKMSSDGRAQNGMFAAELVGQLSKRTSRTEFVRARTSSIGGRFVVTPCSGQESHMLGSMTAADCLIIFDGEAGTLLAGSRVRVLPIVWS